MYVTAEARQNLLDEIARAIDELGVALAALGDAYELLDERSADTLEEQLFRPVQTAYGKAKRTHAEFAARHSLPTRQFAAMPSGAASHGVKGFLEATVESVEESDALLAELQDSLLPVEVGDAQVRAELSDLRELMTHMPQQARELVRTIGR